MIEQVNNLKPHNYKEKNFELFENHLNKIKSNKMFSDEEEHKFDTFNAILESIGLSKDEYYIKENTDFGYNIYKKDSHNFNILFLFLNNRSVFKFEQTVYGHSADALLELKDDIKKDISSLLESFHGLPYSLTIDDYVIKNREEDFSSYNTKESFFDHYSYIRKKYNLKPNDLSFKMTEYESSAVFKGVYSIRKEYDIQSIETTREFISMNIIFHRDFGVKLTVNDFNFITSLNIPLSFGLSLEQRKEIMKFKNQGFFEFDKDGKLTDDSKKILKINFQI